MRDYLKGWKNIQNVKIPPVKNPGFHEKVMIRKQIEPIATPEKETAEEEATVLLNYSQDPEEATTLLENRSHKKVFLTRLMTGETIEITGFPFVMGKGNGCDYLITGNATISRQHARIEQLGEEYVLEDLQSSNHTFVDGKQVNGKCGLYDQMIFQLSDEKFKVWIKE